ncbi:MAG: Zn-dependent protease with chaperone function [Pseudomonadales bacterium]|jgi:Zn-dependent protease with chaperone function
MNFFSAQDDARRKTRLLVLLFSIAVIALIAITNFLIVTVLTLAEGNGYIVTQSVNFSAQLQWSLIAKVSILVIFVIAVVVTFKWLQLNAGGKYVAEALGGVPLTPNTENIEEKRAINVVEEMAIAANMPVPTIYLLANEKGIIAFAAGNTPADAVIGITRGALDQFNREQLQGVVAHEFSHILNGDMRLNGRMMAMISGITFITKIGEVVLHSGSNRKIYSSGKGASNLSFAMLGIGLVIVGWLGTFFGSLIKSAISRQREFLADASAVQFTRNPAGIADALKIIGGYDKGARIISPNAEQASHMFIANGLIGKPQFLTHPPLPARIKRIQPSWNGMMIPRSVIRYEEQLAAPTATTTSPEKFIAAAILGGVVTTNTDNKQTLVTAARQQISALPEHINILAHDPLGACSIVLMLLLDKQQSIAEVQLGLIADAKISGLEQQCHTIKADIYELSVDLRWTLLELTLPTLRTLSNSQYQTVKQTLTKLIKTDKKIDMFEWCVFQVFRHYLAANFDNKKRNKTKFITKHDAMKSYAIVLSCLAYHASVDQQIIERAFYRGTNTAGFYNVSLLAKTDCSIEVFGAACNKLANSYPLLKAKLLKGLIDCAKQDDIINSQEQQIIKAIAAVIDSPLPSLNI